MPQKNSMKSAKFVNEKMITDKVTLKSWNIRCEQSVLKS